MKNKKKTYTLLMTLVVILIWGKLIYDFFSLQNANTYPVSTVISTQEFIPDRMRSDDYTLQSNLAVETVLRQGRKYFIGSFIATQRLAHLNTNALQQLHSYFVSTLPRTYDRNVVSDAFSISRSVVDKATELSVGEWIFVSYKATKLKNVPVEIKAENNEDYVVRYLKLV